MTYDDIQLIFDRALTLSFNKKKILLVFTLLALCGVLVVFFRGLAVGANEWMLMSLTFLPIFLCTGFLLSMGIVLIRIYHDEIKKKESSYKEILSKSWEIMIGASYFCIPIILSYLLLWMLLGVFFLLKEIPAVGPFFSAILAFGPFLINLGSIVLCVLSLAILFFVTPIIALKGLDRMQITQTLTRRLNRDILGNIILALIATFPLWIIVGALTLAAWMTGSVCFACQSPLHEILQWFFTMIPFTAVLAPAVIFFFNFAAESHVLMMKKSDKVKG
ncbi:MAG: hypothetical protein BGO14_06110 [Chlamydiales bacterium 38-26]|nr:hypothetical protein [Chlamydiales bacterium]OJV08465.1 MAG: hypothetical protein BGO14_06110 [Chlamydiales bacterium 38-26]